MVEQCGVTIRTEPEKKTTKMPTTPDPVSNNIIEMEKGTMSLVKGCIKAKDTGKLVLPCSYGSTSYYGLCDIGSSFNVIPYTLYAKIQDDICCNKLQLTEMTIKLADGTFRTP